jgi:hypothetical protein
MNELLQKLLEADVLSAETKKELENAFQTQLDEAIAAARDEAAANIRVELAEQWVKERDALVVALDEKVTEFLEAEIVELKEDIERFRDLEAEYAERLVEAKAQMADELKNDLGELVEKLDTFLEIRLAAEVEELREDLEEVRRNDFGRRIFEAFAEEYLTNYVDEETAEVSLREMQERLADAEEALDRAERERATLERKIKMEQVLEPLAGRSRDVMEAILKNVDTESLDEAYKTFIGRVLREADETSEKENKVLAESTTDVKEDVKKGYVATGDTDPLTLEEGEKTKANIERLRRLAGIN